MNNTKTSKIPAKLRPVGALHLAADLRAATHAVAASKRKWA